MSKGEKQIPHPAKNAGFGMTDARAPAESQNSASTVTDSWVGLEARGGIEPPIWVLQTHALPLGDRAPDLHNDLMHREEKRKPLFRG
jgi:hypothetical protein